LLARTTFQAMRLSGYARVDFRVDAEGPWILEVNSNPCISPDAGFAAALEKSGIRYRDAIARIVSAALSDR
jgi:D-alanine-D-alanine ligase